MASAEVQDCAICFERFDERTHYPRMLSCGHTFCSNCLKDLLNDDAQIACPTCRREIAVPSGIEGIPKNFMLLDVMLAVGDASGSEEEKINYVCQACADDKEQHAALFRCVECNQDICDTIKRIHANISALRNHQIVSIDGKNPLPVPMFCPEHNLAYRFFDVDCGRVICADCVVTDHTGHKCQTLSVAASSCRQDMEVLASKATSEANVMKAAEDRLAQVLAEVDQKYEQESAKIDTNFDAVKKCFFFLLMFCCGPLG